MEVRQREYERARAHNRPPRQLDRGRFKEHFTNDLFVYINIKRRVIYLHIEDPWFRAVKANQSIATRRPTQLELQGLSAHMGPFWRYHAAQFADQQTSRRAAVVPNP